MINAKEVRELFEYNPENGNLTWVKKRKYFSKLLLGNIAGTLNDNGYRAVTIKGKTYQIHRIIWLYVHGKFPENVIDHINGIKDDNRLCNLRDCTISENNLNTKLSKNNVSGIKGIHWNKLKNKWHGQINFNKKKIFIGYFDDFFEACCKIRSARNKYHGSFA
jgi:hypothetical protein